MNGTAAYTPGEQDIIGMRRWLHMHPEESLHEHETAAYIEARLDDWGLPHRRVGETGVYAWLDTGRPGPVTVLRADIDALKIPDLKTVPYASQRPGCSHACGHDMHTAALLGTAQALAAQRDRLSGRVRFLFQQAEEIGAGARLFIQAGCLEGADRVLGLHADSSLQNGRVAIVAGPNNASCDAFTITVRGKSAHVSTPHLGVDALYIASLLVVALQGLATRLTDPTDPVIIGVGKLTAGTAYNALADLAVLEGTTRLMSGETRELINRKVRELAESLAAQHGGTARAVFKAYAPVLVNDPEAVRELHALYRDVPGLDIVTARGPKLGADDMADLLNEVPGAYLYIGTRDPANPDTGAAHHNGHFDIDEKALLLGADLLLRYALHRHRGAEPA